MSVAPVQFFAPSAFKHHFPMPSQASIFPGMPELPLQVLLEHAMAIQGAKPIAPLATPQINIIPETTPLNLHMSTAQQGERLRLNSITKRRNRTTFTHEQAAALEKHYQSDQYMPRSRRALVAESLNLSECQVKTWFQNRRAKDKRNDKQILDQMSPRASSSSPRNSIPDVNLALSLSPKAVTAPVSPMFSLGTPCLMPPTPNLLSPLMAANSMFHLTPSLAQLYLQALNLNLPVTSS